MKSKIRGLMAAEIVACKESAHRWASMAKTAEGELYSVCQVNADRAVAALHEAESALRRVDSLETQ